MSANVVRITRDRSDPRIILSTRVDFDFDGDDWSTLGIDAVVGSGGGDDNDDVVDDEDKGLLLWLSRFGATGLRKRDDGRRINDSRSLLMLLLLLLLLMLSS